MSVMIMTDVWKMDLPSTEKLVLLALADAANDDGITWIAVVSRKQGRKLDLLKKTSLSERAIQGAIKRLSNAGHLRREERPGKGVIYHITPAPPAPRTSCAPAANDHHPRTACGETVSNRQLVVAAATREANPTNDDWPEGDLVELADLLAQEANTSRLPVGPGDLALTSPALSRWRAAGASWTDTVVPVVTAIARMKGAPIKSWRYFDAKIAESLACFRDPLPAAAQVGQR